MKQHIILFLFLLGTLGISASNAQASLQEVIVKDSSKLLISCEEATVSLSGTPSASLRISMEPGTEALVEVTVTTDPTGFEFIQIRDKLSRPKLAASTKGSEPKNHAKIEISGRSMPTEIHLLEGHVSLQKWQKEIYSHVQKGKIIAKDNSSSLILHMQKGEISVTDHEGKLIIDSLQTSTVVKDLKGDLDLQSFMGELVLEKPKGSLNISANQGSVKVVNGDGSLQFDLQKANLTATQFEGRVEGVSQEGNVVITSGSDPDINIKSQSGRISVSAGSNSGALLNLVSTEGDVLVPSYLKVSRDGAVRSLKGRLKGETQKGVIFVRSQEGIIAVK